jgi:hypothetical protein
MGKKKFDAVKMTRRIRDAHYEALREMSTEERIRFYREKSRALRRKAEDRTSSKSVE